MPYLVVEISDEQSVAMGKLFANQVRVTDLLEIDTVTGVVIEIGTEYQGEE